MVTNLQEYLEGGWKDKEVFKWYTTLLENSTEDKKKHGEIKANNAFCIMLDALHKHVSSWVEELFFWSLRQTKTWTNWGTSPTNPPSQTDGMHPFTTQAASSPPPATTCSSRKSSKNNNLILASIRYLLKQIQRTRNWTKCSLLTRFTCIMRLSKW